MAPLSDRQLCSIVCEAYGDDLPVILRSNVSAYERRPGLNNPIRAHKSVIGVDGVTALREALVTQRSNGFHQIQGCLEIREPLAWHLVRHLQQKLIIVGHASASIRDQRFAADLGFEFVPVMRLVTHWVTAVLVVISFGNPFVRFRSQLLDRYTRFAEVLHHLRELHGCTLLKDCYWPIATLRGRQQPARSGRWITVGGFRSFTFYNPGLSRR